MRALLLAVLLGAASCSSAATRASAPSAPPQRTMHIAFSGGLDTTFIEVTVPGRGGEGTPVCAGRMASDPLGVNYLLAGLIERDPYFLSFGVHGTQQPGTFTIGPYPDGSPSAPGVVNVHLLRGGFAAWNSGTGQLTVDPGGRSGTIVADLPFAGWAKASSTDALDPPTTPLPALHLSGTWLCPPD